MDIVQKQSEKITRLFKSMTLSEGQHTFGIYKPEQDDKERIA